MALKANDLRVGQIEDSWRAASDPDRVGYIEELRQIADGLELLTGQEADSGRWLTRRVQRVARQITLQLEPGTHRVDDN